jgi:hypothetical protein
MQIAKKNTFGFVGAINARFVGATSKMATSQAIEMQN